MTRGAILVAAAAALNLTAFAATSHAEPNGTNSAVEDNVQTIEQFRAKWNRLLDQAAKARNVQHSCADGLCDWEWELRPRVQAKMVESNNGSHQAFYCFLAEPATTWDCYGNTLQKWVWEPPQGGDTTVAQGDDTAIAQGDDTPAYTPTPVDDPNAVPIFTDGRRAHVSAMIGSISLLCSSTPVLRSPRSMPRSHRRSSPAAKPLRPVKARFGWPEGRR